MNFIQHAVEYANQGWKLLPLKQGTKIARVPKWQEVATDDVKQLCTWHEETPSANIGVATGSMSGFWVLDIDVKGEGNGVESLKKLIANHTPLPDTLKAKTASGGYHLFFNMPDFDFRNTAGLHPGIDSRGNGGYVVIPPSILHDGSNYQWVNEGTPIADAPQWLYDELAKKKKQYTAQEPSTTTMIEGNRNNNLTSIAGKFRKQGIEYDQLLPLILDINQKRCNPPLDQEEVETLVRSVCNYAPSPVTLEQAEEVKVNKFADLLRHVNPLGINHEGAYVFYPKNLRCIKAFSANALMQSPTLYSIIGEELLYKFFPKIDEESQEVTGFSAKSAALFLMDNCHKRGTYDLDMMKGIGVWEDHGRLVINTGKNLIVDGDRTHYDDFESNYTYAQPGKDILQLGETLNQENIDLLWKMICGFNWAEEYYKYLFLGALYQACIAPILPWRSHIWIVGAQGSGKSTGQFSIVRPLLGELCVGFEHGTTASGIRQSLDFNAFAVSYDEAEVREGDDPRNMQQVVALARISSSRNSRVVKGSASGEAVEYRCQSAFIMSSIKPYLKQESDLARFALLEVMPPEAHEEDKINRFIEDTMGNVDKIDSRFSAAWISLCIKLIPDFKIIKEKVFTQITKSGCSPRARDQYGQLIAGAVAILGEDQVDMTLFDSVLDGTKDYGSDAEPLRELSRLLNEVVEMPTKHGSNRITLLKAIDIVGKDLLDSDYIADDVNDRLCSYGLKVFKGHLYIANTSSKLEKIMGSPNWNNLFKIIPWMEMGRSSTTFGISTYKSRYVRGKINRLFDQNHQNQQGAVDSIFNDDAGF